MKFFQAYHLLIFFSLTITSPAIAKFAKTMCKDTCGNIVMIPYPFGIGADCSANKWYTVDCKSSTPYLRVLNNHLEVLRVDLQNQTVIVSTPRITDCQNSVRNSSKTTSIDLGGSPFLFSKVQNKFVFEGCGIAVMSMDDGSVVTGCSTTCLDIVTVSNRNNCTGIGCCQTIIPGHLSSYSMSVTGFDRQGEDEGCGSAFLVDETSYDPFIFKNSSFVPVSLLWTLTDSDQVTCLLNVAPRRVKVDMFNGTQVHTLGCGYYYSSRVDNPYLTDGLKDTVPIPKNAKTGCNDTCGNNVTIHYPFGIGVDCSANHWYIVDCNSSTPYLHVLNNHLEVLGVSLKDQTVTVSTPRISNCQKPVRNSNQTMSMDLGRSPFLFSKSHNKIVFEGCGTAVMMDNGSVVTACSTTCRSGTQSDRNNCFGNGCCQTTIPNYIKSYNINLTNLEEEDRGCGFAFLVDEASYDHGRFSESFVPISLMWTLADGACCDYAFPIRVMVDMFDGTQVDTLRCYSHSSTKGNPYIIDGCVDEEPTDECRRCRHSGGYSTPDRTYNLNGSVFSVRYICIHDKRTPMGVILGH